MKDNGLFFAILAYAIWGFAPIFWKQLDHIGSIEIALHRFVWTFVFAVLYVFLRRQWSELKLIYRQKDNLLWLMFACVLITLNSVIFIWAVNNNQIIEASMGYFINPLVTVFLGMLFFNERLKTSQWIAIVLVSIGVIYLVIAYGTLPWVALSLAFTFGLYGVIKKKMTLPAVQGMAVEMSFLVAPLLACILYLQFTGTGSFGADLRTDVFFILSGIVTLTPLLLFVAAAKRISMVSLGMSQYIGPTIQLLIGIFLYGEDFSQHRLIAFAIIWLALLIYISDEIRNKRKNKRLTQVEA